MCKCIAGKTISLRLVAIELRSQSYAQLLRQFLTARNYAVVVRKWHAYNYLLRLLRRSYEKMRRRDRNLFAIDSNTTDASQLRAATPQILQYA
jgi:hypothetical protein